MRLALVSTRTSEGPPEARLSARPTGLAARQTLPTAEAELVSVPQASSSIWKVEVISRSGTRSILLWNDDEASIGRAATQRIRIDCASVSREHAVLFLGKNGDGPPTILDRGSYNGTIVDNRRLAPNEVCPLADGSQVKIGLATLVVHRELRRKCEATPPPKTARRPELQTREADEPFVVRAKTMVELYARARSVAGTDLPVLILGETGVGKEHLAETVHSCSPRRANRLVRINCAALTMTLVEAELFGHERGAFTGATAARAGLIEAAEGGTLFLDEIGDLHLDAQAKLLRTLEVGEYFRLGSTVARKANVRFISATHRDLGELVRQGLFRADLYHRLNGIALRVAPLRERVGELPELLQLFGRQIAERTQTHAPVFADDAVARLAALRWPGNVRELRRFLERWMALESPSFVRVADVERWIQADELEEKSAPIRIELPSSEEASPPSFAQPKLPVFEDQEITVDSTLESRLRIEIERRDRDLILEVLRRCGGNQGEAAREMGISRRTLINRLDALKIPRPRKRLS